MQLSSYQTSGPSRCIISTITHGTHVPYVQIRRSGHESWWHMRYVVNLVYFERERSILCLWSTGYYIIPCFL